MKTANEARKETAEARKRLSEERMARINKLLTDNDVSGKIDAAIARGDTNTYVSMEKTDGLCGTEVTAAIKNVVRYLTQLGYFADSAWLRGDIYRIDIGWNWL